MRSRKFSGDHIPLIDVYKEVIKKSIDTDDEDDWKLTEITYKGLKK